MSQEHFVSIAKRIYGESGSPERAVSISSEFNAFFYSGAQRQHQLETIRHLASYGDLILTLTADVGAGKTALLSEVAAQLVDELHVVFLSVGPEQSFGSLVSQIAEQSSVFTPPAEQPDVVLQRCREAYENLHASNGKRAFLILDDADRLDEEDLVGLIESLGLLGADSPLTLLCSSTRKLESLEKYYDKDSFYQLNLAKLKRHEIGEYVEQGLASVGYSESLSLSDAKLDALLVRSHGLPACIETYMGSVIFASDDSYSESIYYAKPTKVPVAVLGAIVVVLLGSFVFVAHQHNLFAGVFDGFSEGDQGLENFAAKKQRIAMLDKALKQSENFESEAESEALAPSQKEVLVAAEYDGQIVTKQNDLASGLPEENSIASTNEPGWSGVYVEVSQVETPLDDSNSEQAILSAEGQPLATQVTSLSNPATELSTKGRQGNKPQADEMPVLSNVAETSLLEPSSKIDAPVSELGSNSEPVTTKPIAAKPDSDSMRPGYRNASWVLKQQDGAHTYQVLGSYNESTAKRFVERNPETELYYVRSSYKGKPWYVVLYGVYPDASAARKARPQLPKNVALEKPWIRSFSGLK